MSLLIATPASAQWGRRNVCPPQPCPPPLQLAPSSPAGTVPQGAAPSGSKSPAASLGAPTQPPTESAQKAATPTQPQQPAPPNPNLSDQIANAAANSNVPSSFAAAAAPQNLAPNMIGDFFAGQGSVIEIPTFRPGVFDGATARARWSSGFFNRVNPGETIEVIGFSDAGQLQVRLKDGTTPPGFQPSYSLHANGVTSDLVAESIDVFTPGSVGPTIPLQTTAPVAQQAIQLARDLIVAGETANLKPGETIDSAAVAITDGTAQRRFGQGDPSPEEPVDSTFNAAASTSIRSTTTVLVEVPSPSGGGIFGRLKLSENNSPMPRDRVFIDYSYFSDVPIATKGAHVQVFRPGFEKTFFNETASLEVRTPFAATLDNNQDADAAMAYNAEFGNVTVSGKALLYALDAWAFSAGFAVIMPTADDIRINSSVLGHQLIQVNNQAYHVQPYLAALFTPNDRFFMQTFLQFDFCTNGNAVFTDLTGAGLNKTGQLNDQTNLFWDVGAGYWMYRNLDGNSLLRGLAPILEFHYNQALTDADVVELQGLGIGDLAGKYSIVNTTLGLNVDLRTNTSLMLAVALPLTTDRQFNYELALQLNQRLGAAGRAPYTSPDF